LLFLFEISLMDSEGDVAYAYEMKYECLPSYDIRHELHALESPKI